MAGRSQPRSDARFKALLPDKLPIAKTYNPDTVHYGGEVVVRGGATYQALRDTARAPPHVDDWVCLASAGRDAVMPTIRGTYDVHEEYKMLDIVEIDGGAFIAMHDNPGNCPGDGWQPLSQQGRPGRKGETGERGMRGERGEKGELGPSIISWQIDRERYRANPLMSNGTVGPMLELLGLFEQFLIEAGSV